MQLRRFFLVMIASAMGLGAAPPAAQALTGPYKTAEGSYQFLARDEPLVATDRMVDLWAQIYRPVGSATKPWPLLIFLHGNHATCGMYDPAVAVRRDNRSDYTTTGVCPEGYTVTPNHLGYAYVAKELASWGYMVVSINANRGINAGAGIPDVDRGLNLMRGRLILRHLALLSDWNRGRGDLPAPDTLGFDPKGVMDFSEVGMMGHSRGGEGVRAAIQQYRDEGNPYAPLIEPIKIKSLFEIGPVDGQTGRQLNADGVNSMILLPGCDGDVSNLQGIKVLDRVFTRRAAGLPSDKSKTFHGTLMVWGANHNAFNTEWLTSDSQGCRGSNQIFPASGRSEPQQIVATETMLPFFRATVGKDADPSLAKIFDPNVPLPTAITALTNIDRGYLPRPINGTTRLLESFSGETGASENEVPTTAVGVDVVHGPASYEHDIATRVATINWGSGAPDDRYFQVNFPEGGVDMQDFKTLSFRTALRCYASVCEKIPSTKGEMTYTVQLLGHKGLLSAPVSTKGRVRISRPTGLNRTTSVPDDSTLHSTLYTVEIPIEAFEGGARRRVAGVRFNFGDKPEGTVDITDIAMSKIEVTELSKRGSEDAVPKKALFAAAAAAPAPTAGSDRNRVQVAPGGSGSAQSMAKTASKPMVDIVLTSQRAFPVTGDFPKLTVGDKTIEGGVISADGKTMTISVPSAEYDALDKGADMTLFVQDSSPVWKFGALE